MPTDKMIARGRAARNWALLDNHTELRRKINQRLRHSSLSRTVLTVVKRATDWGQRLRPSRAPTTRRGRGACYRIRGISRVRARAIFSSLFHRTGLSEWEKDARYPLLYPTTGGTPPARAVGGEMGNHVRRRKNQWFFLDQGFFKGW